MLCKTEAVCLGRSFTEAGDADQTLLQECTAGPLAEWTGHTVLAHLHPEALAYGQSGTAALHPLRPASPKW